MGRFGSFLLLATVAAAPSAAAGAQRDKPAKVEIIDLTDEFGAFWKKSQGLAEAEKVSAFKAYFEPLIPGFFRSKYFDPLIARSLQSYPEQQKGIAIISRTFASSIGPARRGFEAAFGTWPVTAPIYLIHSTGEMDGSVRRIQGKDHLVFGADRLASRLSGKRKPNLRPLLHHELFHLHHGNHFTGCWNSLWCGIWREGLATYAAQSLNPTASDEDLSLGELRGELAADPSKAICLTLTKLDSTEPKELRDFVSLNYTVPGLPPRFGYYVGFLAASELAKTHSLQQLAKMPAEQVRPLMEKSLRSLSTCPATISAPSSTGAEPA